MLSHKLNTQSFLKLNSVLLSLVLVLMPFHAAIVTIIGSHVVDYKLLIQSWKEIIIAIVVTLSFFAYLQDRSRLKLDTTNLLAAAIIIFSIIVSLIAKTEHSVILAGIKTNLVVLSLFLATQTFSNYFHFGTIKKIILIPGFLVVAIAFLQPYVFTPQLLSSIGYNVNSIVSGQFVETANNNVLRVFSTLGGPNQLGAYLILPTCFCLGLALKKKQWYWWLGVVVFVVAIYMTYSRSAWLGMVFAALVMITATMSKKIQLAVVVAVVVLTLIGLSLMRSGNFCRSIAPISKQLLHGDCKAGVLGGSDMLRIKSVSDGISKVAQKPLGLGLGTAGPASYYSNSPIITENWYLQIAIEVGLIGLVGYLVFFVLNLVHLYNAQKTHSHTAILALILLGAMGGVLVTGLFLHSLADSTLSILLFSLLALQKGGIKT